MPVPAPDASRLERLPVLPLVAASCLLLQTLSAAFVVRNFETPNASAAIARNMAQEATYVDPATKARAYHLPGEAVYLAAGFRWLPQSAWRFLHVPVSVVLVTGIAAAGLTLGGPSLALLAGAVASLEPFLLVHGPVWDDTFLAAALEWTIFALLLWKTAGSIRSSWMGAAAQAALLILVAACAAAAGLSRLQSQVVLGAIAIAAIASHRLRPIRSMGWVIVIGLTLGLGAWGTRNAVALGHIVIGSTHDGKTLEESTGPIARQAIFQSGQAGGSSGTVVTTSNEVEADRELAMIAWRYMSAHPADFLKTASLKVGVTLLGIDLGLAPLSRRNFVVVASSVILLIAGTAGLWSLYRGATAPPVAFLLASIVTITSFVTLAMLILGPVGLRYRLGLSALLYLGTAHTLLGLADHVTGQSGRGVLR